MKMGNILHTGVDMQLPVREPRMCNRSAQCHLRVGAQVIGIMSLEYPSNWVGRDKAHPSNVSHNRMQRGEDGFAQQRMNKGLQ